MIDWIKLQSVHLLNSTEKMHRLNCTNCLLEIWGCFWWNEIGFFFYISTLFHNCMKYILCILFFLYAKSQFVVLGSRFPPARILIYPVFIMVDDSTPLLFIIYPVFIFRTRRLIKCYCSSRHASSLFIIMFDNYNIMLNSNNCN